MQHRIVIRRHRPWMRAALIGGAAFLLVIGAVAIFSLTRRLTVSDYRAAQTELERLRDERRSLARELRAAHATVEELQDQLAYLERSRDIDLQACETVRTSLANTQTEVADLREQVAFYRGIVSPEESRSGVRVLEIKARPTAEPQVWALELVLIQSMRQDQRVSGRIEVQIIGSEGGKSRSLPMEQLLLPDASLGRYSFKYFEEFGLRFRLPPGFRPLQVTVTLHPQGEGMPPIEDQFPWARIVETESNP